MKTKTDIAKEHFKNKEYKKSLKIFKTFNRIFNKEELDILNRAYECFSFSSFYKQLNFDCEKIIESAKELIIKKYGV